jgi:hypothetical protein
MLPNALRDKIRQAIRQPGQKDKLARLLRGVTKSDLQQASKVRTLVEQLGRDLRIHLTATEVATLTTYFISLRIDPNNPLHLIKLWSIF